VLPGFVSLNAKGIYAGLSEICFVVAAATTSSEPQRNSAPAAVSLLESKNPGEIRPLGFESSRSTGAGICDVAILPENSFRSNSAQPSLLDLIERSEAKPAPRSTSRKKKSGPTRHTSPVSVDAFEAVKTRGSRLYLPTLEILIERVPQADDCPTARQILRALIARGAVSHGFEVAWLRSARAGDQRGHK